MAVQLILATRGRVFFSACNLYVATSFDHLPACLAACKIQVVVTPAPDRSPAPPAPPIKENQSLPPPPPIPPPNGHTKQVLEGCPYKACGLKNKADTSTTPEGPNPESTTTSSLHLWTGPCLLSGRCNSISPLNLQTLQAAQERNSLCNANTNDKRLATKRTLRRPCKLEHLPKHASANNNTLQL